MRTLPHLLVLNQCWLHSIAVKAPALRHLFMPSTILSLHAPLQITRCRLFLDVKSEGHNIRRRWSPWPGMNHQDLDLRGGTQMCLKRLYHHVFRKFETCLGRQETRNTPAASVHPLTSFSCVIDGWQNIADCRTCLWRNMGSGHVALLCHLLHVLKIYLVNFSLKNRFACSNYFTFVLEFIAVLPVTDFVVKPFISKYALQRLAEYMTVAARLLKVMVMEVGPFIACEMRLRWFKLSVPLPFGTTLD